MNDENSPRPDDPHDLTALTDDPQDLTESTEDRPHRTAVVAEDESLIRMDIVETLAEAGYEVLAAVEDGEAAVAKARELRPDVVVMDVKMPQTDGVSAAARIGQEHLAPVVMLTAVSQARLLERARDAGTMAYVVMRLTPADLQPALDLASSAPAELVELARDAGAVAYVAQPFTPADLLPAMEIAISRHQQITQLEWEIADLGERFETRKRVDRAKGLLQTNMDLSEPEAFRW